MRELANLRRGRARRSGLLLLPAVATIVGLAGVTAKPALDLRAARGTVEAARENLGRLELERARRDAVRAAGGQERIEAAIAELDGQLPRGVTELDVHTAVRVAAELNGLVLDRLSVGELLDPGLPRASDVVLARSVHVAGRGGADAFFATLATLDALGVPVSVLEVSLARRPDSASFEITSTLGLYERRPDDGGAIEADQDQAN